MQPARGALDRADLGFDVLLTGSYFFDLIFTGLPEFPRLGAEVYGSGCDVLPGGTYTTAVALHRMGVRVGWACDFGDDLFSRYVLEAARREGLSDDLFESHDRPMRSVTVALSYPHERAFVSYMDPPPARDVAPLVERCRPRWVAISYLQFSEEFRRLAECARRHGARLYMDCQHVPWTLETPGVADALASVDVFAPNAMEAQSLTGQDTVEGALDALAALVPLVVIKLGSEGAVARAGGDTVRLGAVEVEAIDTTGAGDCFNAGFLYGTLRGYSLEECLRCGNVCGGLSTTALGGRSAPTAFQLEEWLRRQPNV